MISNEPEICGTPVAQCTCGACGHKFYIAWPFRNMGVYCTMCGEKVDP